MAIKKLDHVSILSHNPEEVINFYRDFLGFELASKVEIKEMGMIIFNLKAREEYIEVIQPLNNSKMTEGLKHIAFLSDNIEEDLAFFKEKGAQLLHQEVQRYEKLAFFFAKSPSGEFVEVIQYF